MKLGGRRHAAIAAWAKPPYYAPSLDRVGPAWSGLDVRIWWRRRDRTRSLSLGEPRQA
jgi:hypothetical protein